MLSKWQFLFHSMKRPVRKLDALVPTGPGVPRLAYLLSSYPAISHTFFLNEIAELKKHGFAIDVASINQPKWEPNHLTDSVSDSIATTFYIKSGEPTPTCLLLLTVLLTRPLAVCRGLRAVLRLGVREPAASLYSLFYLAEALILGEWLSRRGHTHLHIHFGGPVATVGMLASIAWQIPYSITIHGPEEFYGVEKFRLKQKIEYANFVLCISDHCRSQLMKISEPQHWEKLHLVRLGVDAQLFKPTSNRSVGGDLEILCVGRLVADKGHLVLLRAFSRLLSSGFKLRLRLIGDGSERRRLESFILENRLGDSVTIEGALDHETTRRHLAQADIFVLASFAEGLPVALMEAMAMEIPCVSTYIAGIPELIRPDVDGLLVPASSEEALVEALTRLISDSGLRRSLARSGRLRVLELYSLDTNVGLLAKIFQTQLAKQTAPGHVSPIPSYSSRAEVNQ
jgi:colanic acid/amylovoran biosynthesis glycosyltransferase